MQNQNLGCKAKDKITGFEGTITGFCQYLTGCDQYLLAHKVDKENGKKIDGQWFDVNRIDIDTTDKMDLNTEKDKGACEMAPLKD